MEVSFKSPADLRPGILDSIFRLIADGGEINIDTLRERLLRTVLIGYVVVDNEVVATAAIKIPHDTHLDNVFVKSESTYRYENFQCELGYVMVTPAFQHKGLASHLCEELCMKRFHSHNFYATIRANNYPMQSLLHKLGFVESGSIFRNRTNTEDLSLLVRPQAHST